MNIVHILLTLDHIDMVVFLGAEGQSLFLLDIDICRLQPFQMCWLGCFSSIHA